MTGTLKKPQLFRHLRIERLLRKVQHRGFPRLFMLLLVTLTAGVGFVLSGLMLRAGLYNMGLRYATACGLAYLSFLTMLWVWLKLTRWRGHRDSSLGEMVVDFPLNVASGSRATSYLPSVAEIKSGGGSFDGGGASANVEFIGAEGSSAGLMPDVATSDMDAGVGDVSGGDGLSFDLGELGALLFIVALLAACGALFYAAFNLIGTAPLLFSELIFDGVLAAGLYRRFRYQAGRHWLETALQRTIRPFFAVFLFVIISGFILTFTWPQANSIGDIIRLLHA